METLNVVYTPTMLNCIQSATRKVVALILQSAIDDLVAWSVKWQLKISYTKCMTSRRVTNTHSYHINNELMPSPLAIRDLVL